MNGDQQPNVYREPARDIPVLTSCDVIVCGGGPAGCAAALASARLGMDTLLIEKEGSLGGATVAQGVMTILSTNGADFPAVWHEWASALRARGGISPVHREPRYDTTWFGGSVDPEIVKYAWDDLLAAAGARLLHLAWVAGAIVTDGAIRGALVETKAGRCAIMARRIVDCTGDADVCAASGVPWDHGVDGQPWAMAASLSAWYGGGSVPEGYAFGTFNRAVGGGRSMGMTPLFWAGLLRLLRVNPLDPWDLTRALREGRSRIWDRLQSLRNDPACRQLFLAATANAPGIRSSRRVRGMATATADDAWDLRKYSDGIARCSWEVDVHAPDKVEDSSIKFAHPRRAQRRQRIEQGDWFDIRYGCLVPQGVDDLLVAGRCISAEHEAQSCLRIQQTCMATGHAAGTAAALSLRNGVAPRQLDPALLIAQLQSCERNAS